MCLTGQNSDSSLRLKDSGSYSLNWIGGAQISTTRRLGRRRRVRLTNKTYWPLGFEPRLNGSVVESLGRGEAIREPATADKQAYSQ